MSAAPERRRVLALNVVPYEWAVWCSVGGGEPFANTVEHVSWSEDGQHLWFMLGTYNFYKAEPDKELELVPIDRRGDEPWRVEAQEKTRREHAQTILNRPIPLTQCGTCKGTGKVPVVRTTSAPNKGG